MTRGPSPRMLRVISVAVLLSALAACGGAAPVASTTSAVAATGAGAAPSTTVAPHAGSLVWTPCGGIECGRLTVPATHNEPDGATITVSVYRRAATVKNPLGVLVLLPDWSGWTARDLADRTSIILGSFSRSFDIVSMSPRGFYDSAPLPCATSPVYVEHMDDAAAVAQKCTANPALLATSYGTVEAAHDASALVAALDATQVKVLAWGRGATIAAAWKLTHPAEISAAVLDSPSDPGIDPVKVWQMDTIASDTGASAVMRWCTSHISCPFVENAGKRVQFVLDDIRNGKAGETTEADFRMAFQKALDSGDNGGLFRALAAAENNDFVPLRVFAALGDPSAADSFAARIAGECSDMSAADIDTIINNDAEFEFTLFRIGLGMTVPRICQEMPEAPEPLGFVRAADGARGALVQTYVASGDAAVSPAMVGAFARRAAWKHHVVKGAHHLVVGFDRTTTRAVAAFLTGD